MIFQHISKLQYPWFQNSVIPVVDTHLIPPWTRKQPCRGVWNSKNVDCLVLAYRDLKTFEQLGQWRGSALWRQGGHLRSCLGILVTQFHRDDNGLFELLLTESTFVWQSVDINKLNLLAPPISYSLAKQFGTCLNHPRCGLLHYSRLSGSPGWPNGIEAVYSKALPTPPTDN